MLSINKLYNPHVMTLLVIPTTCLANTIIAMVEMTTSPHPMYITIYHNFTNTCIVIMTYTISSILIKRHRRYRTTLPHTPSIILKFNGVGVLRKDGMSLETDCNHTFSASKTAAESAFLVLCLTKTMVNCDIQL